MPIINHTTATVERLARAAAYLRQAILLIEEVSPGIVEGLVPGAIAASKQPLPVPRTSTTRRLPAMAFHLGKAAVLVNSQMDRPLSGFDTFIAH